MGRGMSRQLQTAIAKVDLCDLLDGAGGIDHLTDVLCPENLHQSLAVVVPARIQRGPQAMMPEEFRLVPDEGGGPETMIGMDMRQDHVPDRLSGPLPDPRPQPVSVRQAAAGIGDENAVSASDEPDIGDPAPVDRRRFLVRRLPDEEAAAQFLQPRIRAGETGPGDAAEAEAEHDGLAAGDAPAGRKLVGIVDGMIPFARHRPRYHACRVPGSVLSLILTATGRDQPPGGAIHGSPSRERSPAADGSA